MLYNFRSIEPNRRALVLLEDIDTLIERYGEADVLSLLDGERSVANVLYIATTNYPEKLDGRIINRPSRFDRIEKIGLPSASARRQYLTTRGIDFEQYEELETWVDATDGFSIAHIKELIIGVCCLGKDFEEEVTRLNKMRKKVSSSSNDEGVGFKP